MTCRIFRKKYVFMFSLTADWSPVPLPGSEDLVTAHIANMAPTTGCNADGSFLCHNFQFSAHRLISQLSLKTDFPNTFTAATRVVYSLHSRRLLWPTLYSREYFVFAFLHRFERIMV